MIESFRVLEQKECGGVFIIAFISWRTYKGVSFGFCMNPPNVAAFISRLSLPRPSGSAKA